MITSSFHLKLISGIEKKTPKEVSKLLSSYDDKSGFGFIDIEVFSNHIQATLVYKTIIYQRIFEPRRGNFSSEQQIVYEQASFDLYPTQQILQSYSGGKKLQKTMLCLASVFKQKVTFEDLFADIPGIIKKLGKQSVEFSIISFTVDNFRPEVGLIGKFRAIVSDSLAARKTIQAYDGDILDIQMRVENAIPSYWYIASNGKVVIKAPDTEALSQDIDLVKRLLREK
jgi:hypothetical protein